MATLYRMPLRISEVDGQGDPVTYDPKAYWPSETTDFDYRSLASWLADTGMSFETMSGTLRGMPATGVAVHEWWILKDTEAGTYEAVAISTGHSMGCMSFSALGSTAVRNWQAMRAEMEFVALNATLVGEPVIVPIVFFALNASATP